MSIHLLDPRDPNEEVEALLPGFVLPTLTFAVILGGTFSVRISPMSSSELERTTCRCLLPPSVELGVPEMTELVNEGDIRRWDD